MPDRKISRIYSHTLTAALALSAQAAGAIHLPIVVAYATLVASSGCLALLFGASLARERARGGSHQGSASAWARENLRVDVGAGVWFLLALLCLLQALPLPLAWLEQIAPSQADIWARALRPFGSPPPALASLSLAPHRTLVEALKMASYGVIFYLAARLGRHGMGRIAAIAFASALAVALVTLAHRALGAERLFGVYAPSDTLAVAPLLNPNSRAGYYDLGFFCGLGLLFRLRAGPRRAFLGLGLVLLVVEILLCQSRGGTAALVLGMLLVPLLRSAATDKPPSEPGTGEMSRPWQVAIVGSIAAGAAAMAIASRPKGGLGFEQSLEKLELFRRAAELVRDHPLWGVGRGAFGSAFSPYQPGAGATAFEYAENLPLQWAAEWGVPMTIVALGAIAWSLWPVLSRRTLASPVRRCALVGVGALCAQNLVDLGLEITAVAALLVYVLGGLLGASLGTSAHGGEPRPRLLPFGAVLTTLCIGLVLALGSDSPARERERLHAQLARARGIPDERFWGGLRSALLAYPADPYFPLLGASAALAVRRDALPWVARAIERAPGSAPAQLSLARALHFRGATDQALAALRRAIELDPASAGVAIRLGLDWRLTPELLARAVPDGRQGTRSLQLLADASQPGSAERVHWLEEALARDPNSAAIHHGIALELYRDVLLGERGTLCRERREDCLRRALDHAARAQDPPSAPAAVLEAQLLELTLGARAAEDRLADGCAPFPGDEACARALFAFALANQSARLPATVRALIAAGCSTRERCAATHSSLGDQYAARDQWYDAQNQFRQATLEWPTADNWRSFANACKKLGQTERAEDALRRAALLEAEKKGAQ
jgi:tetratricopeptide (TPR) repeat protein